MLPGIMVQQIIPGCIITPALIRILITMSEVTLQATSYREEVYHLLAIVRPLSSGRILTEVHKAILFHQEAVWNGVILQVHMAALLLAAADLQVLNQEVLILQDHLPQVLQVAALHQEEVALPQEGDSLKQKNSVN
jgi:hypothetical protein